MPQLGSTRDLFISAWLSSGNFSSNSSLVSTPPSSMLPYLCLLPSWASLASLMGLLCVLCTALSFSFLGKNRGKNVHFYILFPDFHQPYASLPSYSKAPRLSWAYIGFVAKMKSYYNFFITLGTVPNKRTWQFFWNLFGNKNKLLVDFFLFSYYVKKEI